MKNILLLLLIFGILTTATATATATTATARAECPSDDADFCSQYNLAQQGDAEAQLTLGLMYYEDEGVAQDIEAVRWWRKAAEQGGCGRAI